MLPVILFIALVLQPACMTTKTNVGNYQEMQGEEYTYAKGKQLWFLWGIFPLGRTAVNTPKHGNCQVVTRYYFGDFLIAGLTAGLLRSYTIKVVAKRPPVAPATSPPDSTKIELQ